MIEQMVNMPTYEAYKDSGVEWLGEIPAHWQVKALKHIAFMKSGETISPDQLTEDGFPVFGGNGFRGYTKTFTNEGCFVLIGRQGALCGNVNYAEGQFFASEHAIVVYPLNKENYFWLGESIRLADLNRFSQSAAQPGIAVNVIKNVLFPYPPLPEQTAIADFLDRKTAQIDQAVAIKEQQISLLKERKQILIQNAVTRGLDPNVPMRDSGVKWIGEIPAHWILKRLKYVLDERNERSKMGEEPLFMVSQTHGLVVRSEFHEKAEVAQSNVDNKIVYKNDLVFNKLKAHLGVFFKSNIDFKGLVSPDYAVYQSNGLIDDLKYLEHLFRHPAYIGQFIIRATGIVEGLIRLYTGDLFQISIPVPPKQEQKAILDHIETQSAKIDQAIAIQQQQIDKLKEFKSTLINSAVTGKIRVPEVVV
jgi:type I restriction enzyme, S subunit